ncbi:transporter substrate-binding domain-containing protein [Thalassotalea sp. M1531]|uniref:Transporter substrate-binding domain-containing protein n=1 Tax=Thalassotalea algicola TaxID=2716224 RepID=A0A7Y0LDM6_9GAMM|nr:transporter substrate-binding domain-containing protein [Thalassotalea algicola]NMP32625.1 transporter substrate-binding domain-containing protein [Thalassotalea algicola]
MILIRQLVVCLFSLFFLIGTSHANSQQDVAHFDLTKQKTYTIAFSEHSYPQQFVNEQGLPDGIMKDFWLLWAKKQNVQIAFVPMQWEETMHSVINGKSDFHAGLTHIKKRDEFFEFSSQIFPQYSFIYLNKSLPQFADIQGLTPYKVGVVKGSSHINTVLEANNKIKLEVFESRTAMYDAALNQEILGFAELEELSDEYTRLADLNALFPKYRRVNYHIGDYSAGVSKGRNSLIAFINQGIEQITIDERNAIESKWLNLKKSDNALNLAFTVGLPPYMDYSITGQPQGLYIDIWRLWSKYSGLKVKFYGDTMARGIEQVKQGNLDAHLAYPATAELDGELSSSAKVYALHSQFFISSRLPNIRHIDQLSGKTVGLFRTSPYIEQLQSSYPDLNLKYFTSHLDMINAAEKGEVDAVVTEVENMKVKLVNTHMQSLFYLLDSPVFDIDMFSLVATKNKDLANFIQQGFDQIPLEELKAVEELWLSNKVNAYFEGLASNLSLNSVQRKWVREQPVLTVGVTSDWAPLEFVDEKGQVQGINRDIIEFVADSAGLDIKYQVYENWANLINSFRRGDLDLMLGVSTNQGREEWFDFTDVYWKMPWSIVHQRSTGIIKNIDYFYGKNLAMVKGYQLIEWFRTNHPMINLSIVDSVEEGVLAVQHGLVEGFVEALPVASKLTTNEHIVPLSVSVLSEIPTENNRIAVRKGNHVLKSIVNEGLNLITERKRQEIFERWFNVNIQTGLDQRFVTKVAAQFGAVILLIIVVVVFWNRKLRQEVSRRKALEIKMKHMATHDELTGLANRVLMKSQIDSAIAFHQRQQVKLAILFIDLDGFKTVNDLFGHDIGDHVLTEVASRLQQCVRKSDTVCRFGGDEFVLLLTGINNKQEATFIAEKIVSMVSQPYQVDDRVAKLGCSIGISIYPEDGDNEKDLLKMADNLMYRVKSSGKNNYMHR